MSEFSLPDWLCRSGEYKQRSDTDHFIDRSIRAFLHILSLTGGRTGTGSQTGLSPAGAAIWLLTSFVFILTISLSQSREFLCLAGTAALVIISIQKPGTIRAAFRAALAASFFSLIVFIPSLLWKTFSTWQAFLRVPFKIFLCTSVAALIPAKSGWTSISQALALLGLPDIFILILDLTVKYIYTLGAAALDMLWALKLRSVGYNRDKDGSLGAIGGTLFLKSREASTETWEAMQCRCFSGSYRSSKAGRLRPADIALVFCFIGLVYAFFFFGGAAR